jgi:hypothetical protein
LSELKVLAEQILEVINFNSSKKLMRDAG